MKFSFDFSLISISKKRKTEHRSFKFLEKQLAASLFLVFPRLHNQRKSLIRMRLTMPMKKTFKNIDCNNNNRPIFRSIIRSTLAFALGSSTTTSFSTTTSQPLWKGSLSFAATNSINIPTKRNNLHLNLHSANRASSNNPNSSTPFLYQGRGGNISKIRNQIDVQSKRRMTATEVTDTVDSSPTSSGEILKALREEMKNCNIDAYIIPSDDPHLSEYVADAYGRRAFVTGFDGSAGTALVTKDAAFLWTDSRLVN